MGDKEKCEKCGREIEWYNKSWNPKLCNKCFSEPVNYVLKSIFGLAVLIFLFWIFGGFSLFSGNSNNPQTGNVNNNVQLNAAVSPIGNDYSYSITNENNYIWHNVNIVIDDYYSCNGPVGLGPGGKVIISGPTCEDSHGNPDFNQIIKSMNITADEGSEYFTKQGL